MENLPPPHGVGFLCQCWMCYRGISIVNPFKMAPSRNVQHWWKITDWQTLWEKLCKNAASWHGNVKCKPNEIVPWRNFAGLSMWLITLDHLQQTKISQFGLSLQTSYSRYFAEYSTTYIILWKDYCTFVLQKPLPPWAMVPIGFRFPHRCNASRECQVGTSRWLEAQCRSL